MRFWVVPALLLAAIAGYTVGRLTTQKNESIAPATSPLATRPRQEVAAVPPISGTKKDLTGPSSTPKAVLLAKSPRQRLVAMLSGHLDDEKLYSTLLNVASQSVKLQREVLDILGTTDDPALMEECQHLIALRDPAMQREVLESFRSEMNPSRRLAWAYILGTNWGEDLIRPTVLDLLDGTETKVQERMLQRMCLQSLSRDDAPDADRERATARLRLLASAGETETLRAAAVGALRGVRTSEDVAFLIETMLHDSSSMVQHEAFYSLPSNYQSPSPLLAEQTRAMFIAALDERRSPSQRKALASRALDNSAVYDSDPNSARFLNSQERASLRAILEMK